MEVRKRLLMTFKAVDGKKITLTVEDPRENVTEAEIKTVMTTILNSNIFAPGGASLAELVEAKVVETNTVEHDLV